MAIYNSDEFNEVRCSDCGNLTFYTRDVFTLTKSIPRAQNTTTEAGLDIMTDYVRDDIASHYYCAKCSKLVATYNSAKLDNKWEFLE